MGDSLLINPLSMVDLGGIGNIWNMTCLYVLLLILGIYLLVLYLLMWRKNRQFREFNAKLKLKVEEKTRDIQERNTFLQNIVDGVSDSVMVINSDYSISLMNRVARKLWDERHIEDPERPKCYEISHNRTSPCDGKEHPCPLQLAIESQKSNTVIHKHFTAQGDDIYMELTAIPMTSVDGNVTSIIELGHDITSHIVTQDKLEKQKNNLEHQVYHDELTQIPNRMFFFDRLRQTISYCDRSGNRAAVVFIDLDNFKEINDSLGHSAGDRVLQETARRLQKCLRTSDTVARLSGDEFAMVINIYNGDQELIPLLKRILFLIGEPITVKKSGLYTTASIGISIYPDDGTTTEVLLKNADTAMYRAKKSGRNKYEFYTST